jgi:hypothetical protein
VVVVCGGYRSGSRGRLLPGCVLTGAGVTPGLLEQRHDAGHHGPVVGAGRDVEHDHGLDLPHLLHVSGVRTQVPRTEDKNKIQSKR